MLDCKGVELKIGDLVVYIVGKNSGTSLETEKVTNIYKGSFNKEECRVGDFS